MQSIGIMRRRPKMFCDCGRVVPVTETGRPLYQDGGEAICDRCDDLRRAWQKSHRNPDNRKLNISAVETRRAKPWTIWGVCAPTM
jgi:hypothetical protein